MEIKVTAWSATCNGHTETRTDETILHEFRISECNRIRELAASFDSEAEGLRASLGTNLHSDDTAYRAHQRIGKCVARSDALRLLAAKWQEEGLPAGYNLCIKAICG